MIARRELTSQGAKARRELIEAMIQNHALAHLGLTGYGPEYAMYQAVLARQGLHRGDRDGRHGFHPPRQNSSWVGAWKLIATVIQEARDRPVLASEVWAELMAPPIGLKEGVVPVLFTAALTFWSEEVAIYQDGTYQPQFDGALVERLVKTPDRFSIKSFGLPGARLEVLKAVADSLAIRVNPSRGRRNTTVLSVIAPLMTRVRALPSYAQRTLRVSDGAKALREALMTSREPDRLLFDDLPRACGLEPFRPRSVTSVAGARSFADKLRQLLEELEGAYGLLIDEIAAALIEEFDVPDRLEIREHLRHRASCLVGRVIDPTMRSFLTTAADEALDNRDWLEAIARNVSGRLIKEWRDDELALFRLNLHELASAFARLESLHFEHRANRHDGFDAHRVTITSSSGVETSRVVWMDGNLEAALAPVVDSAIRSAEQRVGSNARATLLALLTKRLYVNYEDHGQVALPGVQEMEAKGV
jgi:hypothetical protein